LGAAQQTRVWGLVRVHRASLRFCACGERSFALWHGYGCMPCSSEIRSLALNLLRYWKSGEPGGPIRSILEQSSMEAKQIIPVERMGYEIQRVNALRCEERYLGSDCEPL
jgi:hypothetical protein